MMQSEATFYHISAIVEIEAHNNLGYALIFVISVNPVRQK